MIVAVPVTAVPAGMQLVGMAERQRPVIDAARVEGLRGEDAERELPMFIESAALVAELSLGPADIDIARASHLQHTLGSSLARKRERIPGFDAEPAQFHVLRGAPERC